MTSKSKNTEKSLYVKIRNEKRQNELLAINEQLVKGKGEGEYKTIADMSGFDIHTVYKALNPNQKYYSQKIVNAAWKYIKKRNYEVGLTTEMPANVHT